MDKKSIALFFIFIGLNASSQEATVTSGSLEHFTNFQSQYVDARNVDVWLPDGYLPTEQYAVLYMHDGQALYDPSISWNKQSWQVDEHAGKLIADEKTQKFIVVGIWNSGVKRHAEYFPQKPFESLPKKTQDSLYEIGKDKNQPLFVGKINSDNYLKFIVNELKPFIDKTFSTKTDQANTFIAGSSMGGLISLYAICEYPEVFGGAACLSTHWPGIFGDTDNSIPDAFLKYIKVHLPNPKDHKIYFDYGDQTLDALYPPLQKRVDVVMKNKGFTVKNWITRFFPGKEHSENAWAERFELPLEFLLRK